MLFHVTWVFIDNTEEGQRRSLDLFAAWQPPPGADFKGFYGSTDGGHNWHGGKVFGSTGGIVRGLAVDPTNPLVVYAAFPDFADTTGGHIFKSIDAGVHWRDISFGL